MPSGGPTQPIDVAIVGAGPAGAWAAYTIARQGGRVTIFDASHPREKPCGGGVTGRAMALVADALGTSVAASVITHARFTDAAAGQSAVVPLTAGHGGTRALVVASRAAFDAALLRAAQQAGAVLIESRVLGVAADESGARIDTAAGTWRARFLIGADGANSLVRRRLAEPFRRRDLSIATGFFAHGVTSDEIVINMTSAPPGYIWSFPRPDHLAIGVCAQADDGVTAADLRRQTAAWIARTGIAAGARLQPYSWPIPSLPTDSLNALVLSGPRWCLVGDAAGLVDPITREGIYFALQSAGWAADAAVSGRTADYASQVRRAILPELARAARLKAGFFRPAFTAPLMRALQHSPAVGQVMADLIAGEQPYDGLKWRLIRTCEWQLAWRALVARGRRRQPVPASSLGD